MTLTGYQWSRKTKTAQLARELRPKVTKALEEFKSRRCNCDASCGENRYHDRGSPGCVFAVTPPNDNKYNAKKVKLDGYTFDSKREAQVYGELKLREKAGEISGLTVHPKFTIAVNGIKIKTYTADFSFHDINSSAATPTVMDVKSAPTSKLPAFLMTRKLMRACLGIDVEVIT